MVSAFLCRAFRRRAITRFRPFLRRGPDRRKHRRLFLGRALREVIVDEIASVLFTDPFLFHPHARVLSSKRSYRPSSYGSVLQRARNILLHYSFGVEARRKRSRTASQASASG